MKRIFIFLLLFAALLSLPAAAADGEIRAVIAADISEEEIAEVYKSFGIERFSVPEITMTNDMERLYLGGTVPEEQLGTRSISCVLLTPADSGLSVSAENIDWCTEAMYMSAMATAGMDKASIKVAAPFPVSGTAALAGIYMAYEDMTGTALSEDAKKAGALELFTTASLSDSLGGSEALTVVTELKLILEETRDMTDEALKSKIGEIAGEYKIPLNDYQTEKLMELCRGLEKLDGDAFREKAESVKENLEKLGELKDKALSFWEAVAAFFKAIGEFISKLFSIFGSACVLCVD